MRIAVCQGLLLSITTKLVHASCQMKEVSLCHLLHEQDYSDTNEFVAGQDILRALLNSLPLSHLSLLCLQGHASCVTGCFLFLVVCCFWVVVFGCFGGSLSLLECNLYSNSFLTRTR